jgi:GT2 family glycosyltransferase
MPETSAGPAVSVIVSTRNRPDQIVDCLRSILANPGLDFELVVVDQSDDDVSRRAVEAALSDSRLRWLSSSTRGLSRSRNTAVAAARGAVLAFTDDDCRVPTDWVQGIRSIFDAQPDLGLVFGGVLLRPEDRARGFAAEFEPAGTRDYHRSFPDTWGVGANMSIRRAVLDRVGSFDALLGAGAPFFAGEEIDVTIRALDAGYKVRLTDAIAVLHLGVREGAEAGRLIRGYGIGLGATFGKHVRLGTPGMAAVLARYVAARSRHSLREVLKLNRHPGFGLVAALLWGAGQSFMHPIDRRRAVFVGPPEPN